MSTELAQIEIQERDLELVVSDKTLGSLTTNAKQIRDIVQAGLKRYDIANYNESNIDLAKKDKAMLNNAAKVLNTKRLEIEKEWMNPFSEFKDVVNETVKLISECSGKIDIVVKQSEQIAKDNKKDCIRKYWETQNFDLVPFEKIFEARWLNKTEKMKDIYKAIDEKITKIEDDIQTLESIGEDVDLLKSLYLETLNINSTIQHADKLKRNRDIAKANEEVKNRGAAQIPNRSAVAPEFNFGNIPYAQPEVKQPEKLVSSPAEPQFLTRAFRVTTTRDNIIALGDFMNENGIDFEKIQI